MATEPSPPATGHGRRILVGLDASELSLAALEAAARMAAAIEAELLGVFVEDLDLLDFAGLPFTRVIDAATGRPRNFGTADAEREFRRLAGVTRQALARAAGAAAVPWSFRAVRGRVLEQLLAAAHECDLITVGRTGGARARPGRTGRLAQAAVRQAATSVIVMGCALRPGAAVLAVIDDPATATKVLDAAAALTRAAGGTLTLLPVAADAEAGRALGAAIDAALPLRDLRPRRLAIERPGATALPRIVAAAAGGALVLASASALRVDAAVESLLGGAEACLYLVR